MNRFTLIAMVCVMLMLLCKTEAKCRRRELRNLRRELEDKVRSTRGLAANFLRAGFHDCITATRSKPGSGCNGSLRFELQERGNGRLNLAIDTLRPLVEKSCIGWADAIMLAVEATMRVTGGPRVRLVNFFVPRKDATEADVVAGQLPSPRSDYNTLKSFYERKGLSERDLVSSSVGGHALGGFRRGGGDVQPFTPSQERVTNEYAINLVRKTLRNESNADGFNTLDSDDALVSDAVGLQLLTRYAGWNGRRFRPRVPRVFRQDFGSFLVRMSRISDKNVLE